MKANKLILMSLLCLLPFHIWAQPTTAETARTALPSVEEKTMVFAKKLKPSGNGLSIVVSANAEELEAVLEKKFEVATGQKVKSTKGLSTVESAVFEPISPRTLDYYYRVEPVGKAAENVSRVSLFVSAGYYNFLDSETYPKEVAAARTFLQGLDKNTKIFHLQQKVDAQQELVNKQLKEEADLHKESEKVHKDQIDAQAGIKKLEKEIEMLKAKVSENQSKLQKAEQAMAENASAKEAHSAKLAAEKEKLTKLQAELEVLKRDW